MWSRPLSVATSAEEAAWPLGGYVDKVFPVFILVVLLDSDASHLDVRHSLQASGDDDPLLGCEGTVDPVRYDAFQGSVARDKMSNVKCLMFLFRFVNHW